VSHGHSFSTFGETAFLLLQDYAVLFLYYFYGKRLSLALAAVFATYFVLFITASYGVFPEVVMRLLLVRTIALPRVQHCSF
jgi:hypothetical protein